MSQTSPAQVVTTYPLRILSDLHFRCRHSLLQHGHQLRPLFAGAGTVILNGDTLEEPLRTKAEIEADCAEVEAAARAEGVRLIVISGNHDPSFPLRRLYLPELDLYVEHGDGMRPGEGPMRPQRPVGRFSLTALRCAILLWTGFHRRHLRHLRGNMVVGHSHRPGIWRRDGALLFNLGGHSPLSWAYALEIERVDARAWQWRALGYRDGLPYFKDCALVTPVSSRPTGLSLRHEQELPVGA